MDKMNVELITEKLKAQREELKALREEYSYLEKTHKDLFNDIDTTIKKVDNFYESHNLLTRTFITGTKEVKESYRELQNLMTQQIEQVEAVNTSMQNLSEKYHAPKEAIAEIMPQLQEYAKLQKEIEESTDTSSAYYADLNEKLKEAEEKLLSTNLGYQMSLDLIDDSNGLLAQHIQLENELSETVDDVAKAQGRVNDALDKGIEKAKKFKKSGWYDILSGLWEGVKKIAKESYDKMLEVDQAGHDFGRQMGMSTSDINKHTASLYSNYSALATKLGMEFKEMYKFQTTYADVTEKATILSMDQIGAMAAVSRNVGEESVSVASKNLDVFTTSADATIEYLAKGTARAAMEGLNVKKYSEAFANNIKMASKYTFKEGINGIQKMTLLAQRLKFNMESIGAAMDKFSTLEGAIEASAKIQVLGGAFAQNFGNPLQAMSEALLNAEGFTKRIIDTVSAQAKFDSKTGEIDLAPIDKQRLKAYADALGISYDEIHNMATQTRKGQEIERIVGKGKLKEEDIAYLSNKAQFNKESGKWEIFGPDGEKLVEDISSLTSEQLAAIKKTDSHEKMLNASVSEIKTSVQKMAENQKSLNETKTGIEEAVKLAVGGELASMGTTLVTIATIIGLMGGMSVVGSLARGVGKLGYGAIKGIRSGFRGSGGLVGGLRSSAIKGSGATSAVKPNFLKGGTKGLGGGTKNLLGKVAVPLAAVMTVYDISTTSSDYEKQAAEIKASNLSNDEKAQALNDAKREKNKGIGSSIGSFAGGILGGAAAGALKGSWGGPWGMLVGGIVGGVIGAFGGSVIGDAVTEDVEETKKELGGSDSTMTDEEGVSVNKDLMTKINLIQCSLSSIQSSVDSMQGVVKATWYEGHGYGISSNNVKGKNGSNIQEIKVNEIKVNVGGKIKVEGDNVNFNIDKLLESQKFKNGISVIIQNHINHAVNGKTKGVSIAQ